MGLLDMAEGMLGGNQNTGSGNLIGTVLQALNSQPGGLDGIIQSFRQGGLGEVVNSWIGTGANAPVSADQVQSVLGSGVLGDLAAKLGVSPEAAGSHLSELLPGIVDDLTPNGEIPQGGLAGAGLSILQALLAKKAEA
jgi:uncharacterized protein YidB (DUF937 family)